MAPHNTNAEDVTDEDTFYSVLADLDSQSYLFELVHIGEMQRGDLCCGKGMTGSDPPEAGMPGESGAFAQ